ncbi:MAG: hypothetical protein N2513_07335, partial [Deltaproteobacteria bacterium]|nr:hypothetical protein [Deltaproteobacteria bacterium]
MSELLKRIEESLLEALKNNEPLFTLRSLFTEVLFWDELRASPFNIRIGPPLNTDLTFYSLAQAGGLAVFLVEWVEKGLPGITARRAVHRILSNTYAEHLLCYLSSERDELAFVWAKRRPQGKTEMRTLRYEVDSPARTTVERLAHLYIPLEDRMKHLTGHLPITFVVEKLDDAFSVEAVTAKFFEDYRIVFNHLQRFPYERFGDKKWAHDYSLQLLNRLMFLYFIQRKKWLGGNPRFIAEFWQTYKDSNQLTDSFFDRWLSVMFFEAFNNRFHGGYTYFPEKIRFALQMAPYLNGGLFTRNWLDNKFRVTIPDEFFELLFD